MHKNAIQNDMIQQYLYHRGHIQGHTHTWHGQQATQKHFNMLFHPVQKEFNHQYQIRGHPPIPGDFAAELPVYAYDCFKTTVAFPNPICMFLLA